MTEKYLNIDIEDPRSGKIAEVLSNKTAKKILSLLAENEMSASEISEKLDLPLNTVTYNMEKLVSSGLAEEVKGFLWSIKGKRIKKYRVSNRKIIISPRKAFYGVIPAALIGGMIASGVKLWMNYRGEGSVVVRETADAGEKLMAAAPSAGNVMNITPSTSLLSGIWIWAAGGIALAVLVYFLWRYVQKRKNERRLER